MLQYHIFKVSYTTVSQNGSEEFGGISTTKLNALWKKKMTTWLIETTYLHLNSHRQWFLWGTHYWRFWKCGQIMIKILPVVKNSFVLKCTSCVTYLSMKHILNECRNYLTESLCPYRENELRKIQFLSHIDLLNPFIIINNSFSYIRISFFSFFSVL